MSQHLLLVCTANQCRSPMAEVLAKAAVEAAGLDIEVRSAGFLPGGAPATDRAIRTMAARSLDLTGHVSTELDAELLGWADVVLAMERDHLASIAQLDLDALHRSFLLGEVHRWATPAEATDLRSWAARLDAARPPAFILGLDRRDDVADPIGRSARVYRRCADLIARLLDGALDDLTGLTTVE